MLLLVLSLSALTGCAAETTPQNSGTEAANAEKGFKKCWLCPLFQKAYGAVIGVPTTIVPPVSRGAVGLIWVGYALWLAVFILKYVASLQEPDVGSFWKTLGAQTFWVVMGAALLKGLASGDNVASAWKVVAEPIFSGFLNAGLAIVSGSGSGVGCAPGGNAGASMVCLVDALQNKLNFGAGISAIAIFLPTSPFVILVGVIVFIVSTILMFYLPLLLLDSVFRYGISLCMLPLAVAAYVFAPTRPFTGKVVKLFMEIGFYVMIMAAFAVTCVQIIGMYIDRFLPYVKNPGFFISNSSALERVLCGPGITGLMFLCFFLVLFGGVIADFSRALSGGAGGMGGNVKATMSVVKKTASTAKKAASFGINRIKRHRDKKAANDLESKDKDSKEYKDAAKRLQNRGYLAKGKDGKLHATQAYDNLTRNERMKGPFKGLRQAVNNMEDMSADWNQGVIEQSNSRHNHEVNGLSERDDKKGLGVLEDASGENGNEVVLPK